MIGSIWLYAAIYLVLPIFLYVGTIRAQFKSKTECWMNGVLLFTFIGFLTIIAPWHIYSHFVRLLWLLGLIPALVISFWRSRELPKRGPKTASYRLSLVGSIVAAIVFIVVTAQGVMGYVPHAEEKVELTFPMQHGVYAVGQGGGTSAINYHNEYKPQQFALDILKVNGFGVRADGLAPKSLNHYHIYGEPIYSPCSGEVVKAVDQYDDVQPLQEPKQVENAGGNEVILSCENVTVQLSHMKPGSVMVETGDQVEVGTQLGKIGNSGNTTEPHLHIHAERDGVGIPILFDGRFLKRNSLIFTQS